MKFVCDHLLCFCLIFLVQKIIWWSDNPILISPHCVVFSSVFVNMWSIRVDELGVTLVGDFISCLRQKFYKILDIFLHIYKPWISRKNHDKDKFYYKTQ